MSRQVKDGLFYFPLDTNFFTHRKIFNLNKKFPNVGPLILLRLYCDIYREKGYYLLADLDYLEYFLDQANIEEELFFKILNYLAEHELVYLRSVNRSKEHLITDGNINKHLDAFNYSRKHFPALITSASIQEQFYESNQSTRHKKVVDPNIWLLGKSLETDYIRVAEETKFPEMLPFDLTLESSNLKKKIVNDQELNEKPREKENVSKCKRMQENVRECEEMLENESNCKRMSESASKRKEKKIKENKIKERERESKERKKKNNSSRDSNLDKDISKSKSINKNSLATKDIEIAKEVLDDKPEANNYIQISDFSNKSIYGTFNNVWLTDKELNSLKERDPINWNQAIEILSNYKASSNKGYSNDLAAIFKWALKQAKEDKDNQRYRDKREDNLSKNNFKSRSSRREPPVSQESIEAAKRLEEQTFAKIRESIASRNNEPNGEELLRQHLAGEI